jgi:hypothetical protein
MHRTVRRTRFFVNSEDRIYDEATDNYRFVFRAPVAVQDVVAIELVDCNIPRLIAPTFIDRYDFFSFLKTGVVRDTGRSSNTFTDVRLTSDDGLHQLEFSGDMARPLNLTTIIPTAGTPLDEVRIAAYFANDLQARFTLAAHPVLNPVNYTLSVQLSPENTLLITLENAAVPGSFGTVELLFGTGPNRLRQSAEVLGFRAGVDTTPGTNNGAEAPFLINPVPFRYVDVNLKEAQELAPLARVHLQDTVFPGNAKPPGLPRAPRLLKRPVRTLDRFSVDLTLAGGRKPTFAADTGMQFVFEVFSLEVVGSTQAAPTDQHFAI